MTNLAMDNATESAPSKEPLYAFPRIIQTPLAPAAIVEEHELERLMFRLPYVKALPISIFIDDQGRTHLEVNHTCYYPRQTKNWALKFFINPKRNYYEALRTKVIDGSLIKNERRLIGGGMATWHGDTRKSEVALMGILPEEYTGDVDPEIRRNAFSRLVHIYHASLRWLGAVQAYTSPCVIPVKKLEKYGWKLKDLTIREKAVQMREGFPMSLVVRQNVFIDAAYENHCSDNALGQRCQICAGVESSYGCRILR